MKELDQTGRELSRWIILTALYYGNGNPVAEQLILSTLLSVPISTDGSVVRAQLNYLSSAGLAEIQRHPNGSISASITKDGVDVVEYNAECPAGVGRPPKSY